MLDILKDILPKSTKIRGLIDSSAWEDLPPFDYRNLKIPFALQTMYGYDYFRPTISKQCSQKFSPQEQWKCLFGEYAIPALETPYQAIIF